jgi:hypothetical protein
MKPLSPTSAALEGFRVMRREPRAVLTWMLLWLVALSLTATVLAAGHRVVISDSGSYRSLHQVAERFGSFAAVFISLFLLVWTTTTVAAYRAVLFPSDRRAFYLRLGADELRLAIMTISASALIVILGGAPAFLVYVLASPFMAAVPMFARYIATIGVFATVALDIWLGVRLSLIAVETFAERRFHLTAYWPVTQGRFWYLLGAYAVCFFLFFAVVLLFGLVGLALPAVQSIVGTPSGADPLRRGAYLALAGLLAILTSAFFVVSTTLLCACQAHAFRAIVGEGKAGVAL